MRQIINPVRIFRTAQVSKILIAGLISGGFDAAYAVIFFGSTRGVLPHRIFQHIASGLLGPVSFSLGWKSVLLGIVCHFTIAIGAAATYSIAAYHFPGLLRKPMMVGPSFGIAIYLFMNFVVVPLSRVAVTPGARPLDVIILGVLVHMFLIGLPIVLIIKTGYSTRREDAAQLPSRSAALS